LAAGPGEPLASGGRYDNVYARFGLPRPAAGCALDLNNVCRALEAEAWDEPRYPTVVTDPKLDEALLSRLRKSEVACAVTEEGLQTYAEAWGFGFTLCRVSSGGLRVRARSGAELDVPAEGIEEQARAVVSFVKQHRDHD
jgi:ATP phosphoribosyltransferase regulatory subunit HisZ